MLGGLIGPFSLAGRLFGVSESLELTLTEPETTKALLEKTTPSSRRSPWRSVTPVPTESSWPSPRRGSSRLGG